MQTKSWALAFALALASTAIAEDRPRIYFPRNVKRQFFNSTVTRDDAFPPANQTPAPETTLTTDDSGFPVGGASPSNEESDQDTLLTRSEASDADVITLTIPKTVLVIPTATAGDEGTQGGRGSGSNSGQPTSTPDDDEENGPGSSTTDGGIVLAPTGIVSSSKDPSEQPTDDTSGDETADPTDAIETSPGNSTTPADPTDETEVPEETQIPDKTEVPDSTGSEEGTPTDGATEESTPAEGEGETPIEEETITAVLPLPTDIIPDPIESIISSIIDELPPVVNNTDPVTNGTDTDLPTITEGPGPDQTEGPTDGEDPAGTPVETVTEPTPPPTSEPPVDTSEPTVTDAEPTPPPDTTVTQEPPVSTPTSDTTSVPTGDGGGGAVDTESSVEPPGPTVSQNTTLTDGTGSRPTNAPGSGADSKVEETTTFTSVPVASTVTGTTAWLGTKLAADEATSTAEEDLPAPTHSTEALPPGTPKTIDAQDDAVPQPDGTTLIRIVFDRRLHYEFVADNYTAAQQIFTYLPQVISFGEGITGEEIKMMRLAPVNANKDGWFPTGAYLYVPAKIIDSLKTDILLPNSALYHHDYPVAFELASAIDPSFGIFPGSEGDSDNDSDPGGAPFTNSEETPEEQTPQQQGATAGIAFGAVSVAVAYGAAMFIVARRYKRKKQEHRRSSSVTNSSDMRYSPSGSPASPPVMGGALLSRDFSSYGGVAGGRESHGSGRSGAGNSGRTAYISAPVAAENSLGWN